MSDKSPEMHWKDEDDPLHTPYEQSIDEYLAELLMRFIRRFRHGLNRLILEE